MLRGSEFKTQRKPECEMKSREQLRRDSQDNRRNTHCGPFLYFMSVLRETDVFLKHDISEGEVLRISVAE